MHRVTVRRLLLRLFMDLALRNRGEWIPAKLGGITSGVSNAQEKVYALSSKRPRPQKLRNISPRPRFQP